MSKKKKTTATLDVKCPKCGALPGRSCTNYLGHRKQICKQRVPAAPHASTRPALVQRSLFDDNEGGGL